MRRKREHHAQLLRPGHNREVLSLRWKNELRSLSLSVAPLLSQSNKQQHEA